MRDFFRLFNLKMKNVFGDPEASTWLIEKSLLLERENRQVIGSFLYVYDTKNKFNIWYKNPILLEAIEFIIKDVCQDKKLAGFRRLLPILSESYPLLLKYLPKLKNQYDKYFFTLAKYFAHELIARKDLTELTSANIGYGTNHLTVELKGVTQYLKYCAKNCGSLEHIDKKFLKSYLKRFMEYMHPAGYWAECDGPALMYNTLSAVTLMAVANELDEMKTYLKQFKTSADFHSHATLPDGRFIDIMDGRNSNCTYSHRGAFLTLTPEGCALYETAIVLQENVIAEEKYFGEPLALLLFDEKMRAKYGVKKSKSCWSKKNIEKQLGEFLIVKNQSWIAGASNIKFTPRPEGHFNIDYQNLLSLYHTEFGEILGGQNSKNDPEISFFSKFMTSFDGYPVKSPMPKYIPEKGIMDYKKGCLSLMRAYRGFEGKYEVRFISANKLEITLSANARANEYPIQCNLILPCGVDHAFVDSKKKKVTFDETEKTLTNAQTGPYIYFEEKVSLRVMPKNKGKRLKITVPDEATIKWPFKPWDTYNLVSDRELSSSAWYCLMVIDLTNKPTKLLIEIV
jgi:hypothetical protein